ncbi:hypothetical protein HJC99_04295 [Candidatus Saccharibacteria bacterium]|nr:hypothetical protein [Candidatus Saccharibacteria bacterium]
MPRKTKWAIGVSTAIGGFLGLIYVLASADARDEHNSPNAKRELEILRVFDDTPLPLHP